MADSFFLHSLWCCFLALKEVVGSDIHAEGALHHINELTVVDLAVTICVNTLKQLLDIFFAEREVIALQAHAELIRTDSAAVVLVEVGER